VEKQIMINLPDKELIIKQIESLVYLESLGKKTKTVCCEGSEYILKERLANLEETLPDDRFFRIHKSIIINIDYLKGININANKTVLLQNGVELNISHRKYNDFIKYLKCRFNFWQ